MNEDRNEQVPAKNGLLLHFMSNSFLHTCIEKFPEANYHSDSRSLGKALHVKNAFALTMRCHQ